MNRLYIFILISSLLTYCRPENLPGDLAGDGYIRGRLFMFDTTTKQDKGIPVGKKRVTLSYSSSPDTLNYLLNTTTDDEGYFLFQNLRKDKSYRVFYEEKVGDIVYTAIEHRTPDQDSLRLAATVNMKVQNGIHFLVRDVSGPIKDVSICVFTNEGLYNVGRCDGSIFTLKTDEFGRAFKFGIQNGIYYVDASYKLNDSINFKFRKTIEVKNGVYFDTLTLQKVATNGIRYLVIDSTGTTIAAANLCFFTSRVLFSGNSCSGSIFTTTSDIRGIATKFDLPQQKYYVYSSVATDVLKLGAIDSFELKDKIINDTLVLLKK